MIGAAHALQSICSENRVPHTGKMPARLNVSAKSRRRPAAASQLLLRTAGPLAAAGVTGLRGIFHDRDGMLHTVFSADGLHRPRRIHHLRRGSCRAANPCEGGRRTVHDRARSLGGPASLGTRRAVSGVGGSRHAARRRHRSACPDAETRIHGVTRASPIAAIPSTDTSSPASLQSPRDSPSRDSRR